MRHAPTPSAPPDRELLRARELADELLQVNERLVLAGVRMQELAEEAEAAQRRLALLADVGQLLGASFDLSGILAAVAERLVHELCESCSIEVARESGVTSILVPEAVGPEIARAVEYARRLAPSRSAVVVAPGGGDPEMSELCRAAGFAAVLAAPFETGTEARGALTLLARGRRYNAAEVTLVREIAERIGLAVDRAELHQKALDAVRARDDLLAAVSHDLRNPLSAIVLSSALLSRGGATRDAGGERSPIERIQRSAGHMQRLLQDLVDSAKIGAGAFVVDRQPHAVAAVVTDVLDMLAPLSESKHLRVETELDDALAGLVAWMDREGIVRVLTNLVGNAIKFTPEGGSITVGAARAGGEVRLSIRDTGPGILPEDVEHLFDRFWQAKRTARLGTGLGLFIAKEIVEAHGGKLRVESELGAGSSFLVALPLSPPSP
jgi:signal transduction histidine kinase